MISLNNNVKKTDTQWNKYIIKKAYKDVVSFFQPLIIWSAYKTLQKCLNLKKLGKRFDFEKNDNRCGAKNHLRILTHSTTCKNSTSNNHFQVHYPNNFVIGCRMLFNWISLLSVTKWNIFFLPTRSFFCMLFFMSVLKICRNS